MVLDPRIAIKNVYAQLTNDNTGLNNLADGLADPTCAVISLHNLGSALTTIAGAGGTGSLGAGALFAVSQDTTNITTNDSIMTQPSAKANEIVKGAVRDAKS